MSGDVIVTVTLNAALHVAYAADDLAAEGVNPVSRPAYRAGGRGVTVARVLRAFGHDVLAAGLAGGASGEVIIQDLARAGVPTAFTLIRGESRRFFRFAGPAGRVMRFAETGPYITTEELGRFAADYRRLMAGAAAVVLCGSLPDGLPADTYGSLVTYAAEAGVPVILDAGGEELKHAVSHGPDLVVAETGPAETGSRSPGPAEAEPGDLGAALLRLGAGAAAVAAGGLVRVVTAAGEWTARVEAPLAGGTAPLNSQTPQTPLDPQIPLGPQTPLTSQASLTSQTPPALQASQTPSASQTPLAPAIDPAGPLARGALVAGLVPGQLLGWSWPDRLRHALALAAGGAGPWTRTPGGQEDRDHLDLPVYERLLDAVLVEPPAR